jgi:hypothetical protein
MAKSDCLCREKSLASQSRIQYPTFSDLESASSIFQENGYIVVRNLFSAEEIAETCSEISSICTQWYANYLKTGEEDAACDEIANRRPAWKDGSWRPAPGQEELGFRKLFRMTLRNDFFAGNAKHEKVNLRVYQFVRPFKCFLY